LKGRSLSPKKGGKITLEPVIEFSVKITTTSPVIHCPYTVSTWQREKIP